MDRSNFTYPLGGLPYEFGDEMTTRSIVASRAPSTIDTASATAFHRPRAGSTSRSHNKNEAKKVTAFPMARLCQIRFLSAAICIGFAFMQTAQAAIKLTFFPASDYSTNTSDMNASLGVGTFTLDDFSTAAFPPGLSYALSGGINTLTYSSLPAIFNQNTLPAQCYNYDGIPNLGIASWTGATAVTNQVGNTFTNCFSSDAAQTITFNYAPGAKSFGIGLANFQSTNSPQFPITNHELFVNGVDLGVLETLAGSAWSPGIVLNAYLRIDASDGSVITSVAFECLTTLDFLGFSDLAIEPPAVTSTTLTASPTSTTTGLPVTFTATVTQDPGSAVPTGSVTFREGSTVLGTAALDSAGTATLTTSTLPAGSDSITASYGGDSYDLKSASAVLIVTIKIKVPNVVGLTESAAKTAITKAGLTLGNVTTVPSTTVPAGSVVSETPSAGSAVAAGVAVALAVSSGPPLTLQPHSLAFGTETVAIASAAKTFTITNVSGASLSLTSISVTGGQADDFALTQTCGSTLAAGASCRVSVTFKPVSAGAKTSSVSVADSAGSPQSVALTGTGVAAPTVKLSATSLAFGTQAVATTSSPKTFTITNSGAAGVSLTSITVTGAQADDYALTKTCGSTLAAGASCTVSVTFTPVSTGSKVANVTVADGAGSPQSVSLTGTGVTAPAVTLNAD